MEKVLELKNKKYFFNKELTKDLTLADSFVFMTQQKGSGNAEHKLFFGQGASADPYLEFFGGENFTAQSYVSKNNLLAHLKYLKPEYLDPQFDYGKAKIDRQNKTPTKKKKKSWIGRQLLTNEYETRLKKILELDEFSEFTFRYVEIKGKRRYGSGTIPKDLYESYPTFYQSKKGSTKYETAYALLFLLPISEFSSLQVLRYKSNYGEFIYLFKLLPKKSPIEMSKHPYFVNKNAQGGLDKKKKSFNGRRAYKKKFNPNSKSWRSGSARKLSDIIDNAEIYKVKFTVKENTFEYVGQDSSCAGTDSYYGSSLVMFHYEEIYGSKIFDKKILKSLKNITQEELNKVERSFIKESVKRCKENKWFNLNYTGQNQ